MTVILARRHEYMHTYIHTLKDMTAYWPDQWYRRRGFESWQPRGCTCCEWSQSPSLSSPHQPLLTWSLLTWSWKPLMSWSDQHRPQDYLMPTYTYCTYTHTCIAYQCCIHEMKMLPVSEFWYTISYFRVLLALNANTCSVWCFLKQFLEMISFQK